MNASSDNGDEVDLYGVFKLERSATAGDVQRAYKSLSRHFHPDKRLSAADKENAEAIFVQIKQAHDVLSDRVLRFAYDHGGMIAVELVKQSQARASRMEDNEEHGEEKKGVDEEDEEENSYLNIQKAKSRKAALKIVRRIRRDYEMHKASTQRRPLETTLDLHHRYHQWGNGPSLAAESATMRLESSQSLTNQIDVSLNCTSHVQKTATAAMTIQVGIGYRPDTATQCHVFGAASTTGGPPQISLQTSRRLYDKSMLTIGAGGSLAKDANWSCTLASSRVLLLGSLRGRLATAEDLKVNASWRVGLGLSDGTLQSIMGQIRTSTFPQWKMRLGIGGPVAKVSYNHAPEDSWHATFSWHWLWWKAKITKEDALTEHWSVRYGVKYDLRGLAMGQPWGLLLHLHSDEWTLRMPIDLVYGSEWPVTTVLSVLAAHWLEDLLEGWSAASAHAKAAATSSATDQGNPFRKLMQRVAAKKRAAAEESEGLVVLTAIWHDFSETSGEDVTDLLQFWTVDNRLQVEPNVARWASALGMGTEDESQPWWRMWLKEAWKRWRPNTAVEESLYVRYQYQGRVYELHLHEEESLTLPSPRASFMGEAGLVL